MKSAAPKLVHAVHIGISGFPVGSAAINKCKSLYCGLLLEQVEFLIINNRPIHSVGSPYTIEMEGVTDGMRYVYTPLSPYKSKSFFGRRLSNFVGRVREATLLIRLCRKRQIDLAFYYPTNGSFLELIWYRTLSKLCGFKIIAHYVEYRTEFKGDYAWERLANRLYDKYFMRLVDAVLPISDFLIQHLNKKKYTGPYLKVPPLVDFSKFHTQPAVETPPYFFYVGTAAYLSAIEFILEAFDQLGPNDFQLHLLVNGDADDLKKLQTSIGRRTQKSRIKHFSNLSFEALIEKYAGASALLIALTDSVQDTARFPQKIAEYLASGNPVITTRNGEVPNYLTDGDTALVANHYDVREFSEKMNFVIQNPEVSKQIGARGRAIGLRFFDITSYRKPLRELADQLITRKH
jgi:glycosyltransferase involved in cell wall biosynthesis